MVDGTHAQPRTAITISARITICSSPYAWDRRRPGRRRDTKGRMLTDTAEPIPRDWKPGRREMIAWNVLGAVILIVVTSALFAIIDDDGVVEIELVEIVGGMLAFALLTVAHELIHGVFMRLFGGRPEYG